MRALLDGRLLPTSHDPVPVSLPPSDLIDSVEIAEMTPQAPMPHPYLSITLVTESRDLVKLVAKIRYDSDVVSW